MKNSLEECVVTFSKTKKGLYVILGFIFSILTFGYVFAKKYMPFFEPESFFIVKNIYTFLQGDSTRLPEISYRDSEHKRLFFGNYYIVKMIHGSNLIPETGSWSLFSGNRAFVERGEVGECMISTFQPNGENHKNSYSKMYFAIDELITERLTTTV